MDVCYNSIRRRRRRIKSYMYKIFFVSEKKKKMVASSSTSTATTNSLEDCCIHLLLWLLLLSFFLFKFASKKISNFVKHWWCIQQSVSIFSHKIEQFQASILRHMLKIVYLFSLSLHVCMCVWNIMLFKGVYISPPLSVHYYANFL